MLGPMTTHQRAATLRLNVETVRGAMRSHGITSQEQLADEIGVGRATVVRAMTRRSAPGDALLAGLAVRLGLSLDDLAQVVAPRKRRRDAA